MSEDMLVTISSDDDGRVAIIGLNRPRALNALNGPLLDALDLALDQCAQSPDLRAVIIAGNSACFSAGADLKENLTDREGRIGRMHALAERLQSFPVISIAAIEGWALGGGLELAMACTFRVAAPGAMLGLPEVRLGVIPSYGGTQLAPRLIGEARALELLCLGEPIDAVRAEQIGLINWLAAEPGGALPLALERAAILAERAPQALSAVLEAVREGSRLTLAEGLDIERRTISRLMSGADAPNAALAFGSRQRGSG